MAKKTRTPDDETQSRPMPPEVLAWVAAFPRFQEALELARERAREENWGFRPGPDWVLRQVLAAGLEHTLGQAPMGRTFVHPGRLAVAG